MSRLDESSEADPAERPSFIWGLDSPVNRASFTTQEPPGRKSGRGGGDEGILEDRRNRQREVERQRKREKGIQRECAR